jgi:hypothetical protein
MRATTFVSPSGEFELAHAHLCDALKRYQDLANPRGIVAALTSPGRVALRQRRYERGLLLLGAAATGASGVGLPPDRYADETDAGLRREAIYALGDARAARLERDAGSPRESQTDRSRKNLC